VHTEQELRRMFDRLWDLDGTEAGGKRLVLLLRVHLGPDEGDLAGMFSLPSWPGDGCVRVRFYRRDHQDLRGDALEELCVLAHELGHWRSWLKGEASDEYRALVRRDCQPTWPSLTEREKLVILDEESRAWRYGFEIAAGVGFMDRESFGQAARKALGIYCARLELPAKYAQSFAIPG
jgi:hypothetical protein